MKYLFPPLQWLPAYNSKTFGVPGGGTNFFSRLSSIIHQLPDTNYYVFAFGLIAFILILVGEKYFHGKPIAIYVVILSVLLISFTPLANHGFKTVGLIPAGLPKLHFPRLNLADIQSVISLSFACFLLAYIDSSGARLIKKFYTNLESKGVIFKVAEAHSEVRDILRFEDVEHLLGHVSRRDSINDVITNTLTEAEMRDKIREESI